ncbi:hypothetical protein GCM10010423_57080 [Streptomyces levis]|uniref:Uncharacterized protein n=1 Tax=Streptomyces levis TaxID=285566 RepID=A0ABN3P0C9_9ACTN
MSAARLMGLGSLMGLSFLCFRPAATGATLWVGGCLAGAEYPVMPEESLVGRLGG